MTLLKLLIGLAVENHHLGLAKRRSLKFGCYPYHFKTISDKYVLRAISFVTTEMPTHKSFSIFGSNFCRALKVVVGKNGYVSEPCTFSGHVCDFEVCFDAKNRPVGLPGIWKYVHVNRALLSVGACEDASRISRKIDVSEVPLLVEELKSSESVDQVSPSNLVPGLNQANQVSHVAASNRASKTSLNQLPSSNQLLSNELNHEPSLSQANTVSSSDQESNVSSQSEANVVHNSSEESLSRGSQTVNDSCITTESPNKVVKAKTHSGSKEPRNFYETDAFEDERTLSCILEAVTETSSLETASYENIGTISCYDAKTHRNQTFSSGSDAGSAPETEKLKDEKPKDEKPISKMYIRNSGFSVHLASDWGQYFVSTGALLKRKVLFELNGPMHYAVNDQRHVLGKDVVKKRQLEAMGWEVIPVSLYSERCMLKMCPPVAIIMVGQV